MLRDGVWNEYFLTHVGQAVFSLAFGMEKLSRSLLYFKITSLNFWCDKHKRWSNLRFRKLITLGCNGRSGKNQHVGARRSSHVLSYCLVQQGPDMHRDLATLLFKTECKFHIYTDTSEDRSHIDMWHHSSEFPWSRESYLTRTLSGKALFLSYLLQANLVWFIDSNFYKKWCLGIKIPNQIFLYLLTTCF